MPVLNNTSYYDKLRILATVAVITIHVSCTLFHYKPIGSLSWWIGSTFDAATRFGVPIFLMISGALLLPKRESIGAFYKKRVHRILLPFLVWLIIYHIHSLPESATWTETCYRFITGICSGSSYHLWYIYMLVGIYMFIPFLRTWIQELSERGIRIVLIVWLFILMLRLTDETSKLIKSLNIEFFNYAGYVIFGYYLSLQKNGNRKRIIFMSIVFTVTGMLATLFGTYFISLYKGKPNELFFNCLSPSVVLMSAGLFLLFKNIRFRKDNRLGKWICIYSYGIYLSHVFVLEHLKSVYQVRYLYYVHPIIGIPVVVALCLFLSLFLIMLINRIPKIGKYISG